MTAPAPTSKSITRTVQVALPMTGMPPHIPANYFQFVHIGNEVVMYLGVLDPHVLNESMKQADKSEPSGAEPLRLEPTIIQRVLISRENVKVLKAQLDRLLKAMETGPSAIQYQGSPAAAEK